MRFYSVKHWDSFMWCYEENIVYANSAKQARLFIIKERQIAKHNLDEIIVKKIKSPFKSPRIVRLEF